MGGLLLSQFGSDNGSRLGYSTLAAFLFFCKSWLARSRISSTAWHPGRFISCLWKTFAKYLYYELVTFSFNKKLPLFFGSGILEIRDLTGLFCRIEPIWWPFSTSWSMLAKVTRSIVVLFSTSSEFDLSLY